MAVENPDLQRENADAEPHDADGLDAAAEAFAADAEGEQDNADEPAHEPEDEADTDAEGDTEADPEADEPKDDLAEVEINGKTYQVPKELQKGYLRQADYSRAMNEVAAEKKTYAERLAQVDQVAEGTQKYAEALAAVKGIESELAKYESVDWASLERENPVQANAIALRQLKLQQQLAVASQNAKEVGSKVATERDELLAKAKGDMLAYLSKNLKGWGDAMGETLTKYATSSGVDIKTLQKLTDPGVVIALAKAKQWDDLQASKPAVKAKAQGAAPVTKPSAPRGKPDQKAEALKRHKSDGSIDSATAAFLAAMR